MRGLAQAQLLLRGLGAVAEPFAGSLALALRESVAVTLSEPGALILAELARTVTKPLVVTNPLTVACPARSLLADGEPGARQ
jgi:hypothetical protein